MIALRQEGSWAYRLRRAQRALTGVCVFGMLAVMAPGYAAAGGISSGICQAPAGTLVPLQWKHIDAARTVAYQQGRVELPRFIFPVLLKVEGGRVGQCCSTRNGKRVCSADNKDPLRDCGPFQINETNFGEIARTLGVSRQEAEEIVRDNGCANAFFATTYLLRGLRDAHGNLFEAMGYYHSHTPIYKVMYQRLLKDAFRKLLPQLKEVGLL